MNLPIRITASNAILIGAFVTQTIFLIIIHHARRYEINEDAVSYIRIAQYYLNFNVDLMISGYWGPLLSWLIAPWLLFFQTPLYAGHAAMILSAGVFSLGSYRMLRALKLPDAAVLAGTWICALVSVGWSIGLIAPDLLEAGLLCFGVGLILSDSWPRNGATSFFSGAIFGIAFLAKAVALPVSLLIIVCFACQHAVVGAPPFRFIMRSFLLTLAGLMVVTGPWIYVLSTHYGNFVFSTSGPINHALVGPTDVDRYHPSFRTFHQPVAGRITSWEDPLPEIYEHWSPLDNWGSAKHQAQLIYANARDIGRILAEFDWLGLGLVSALLGYIFCSPWRETLRAEYWRWAFIPVLCGSAIYLPVYADSARYFWPIFPFLLAAAFGFTGHLANTLPTSRFAKAFLSIGLVTISFAVAQEPRLRQSFSPVKFSEYELALKIAERLDNKELVGPIASVGWYEIGYYAAFILGVPWYGNILEASTINEVLDSNARLIFSPRGDLTPLVEGQSSGRSLPEDELILCDDPPSGAYFDIFVIENGALLPICSGR